MQLSQALRPPRLLMEWTVQGGGNCRGGPCWTPIGGRGFRWRGRATHVDGLRELTLRSGADGRARISLYGRAADLRLPPLPLSAGEPISVQLVNDTGNCWSATYRPPDGENSSSTFTDRSD